MGPLATAATSPAGRRFGRRLPRPLPSCSGRGLNEAGVLIVREAGGVVSQLDGAPFAIASRPLLASSGNDHVVRLWNVQARTCVAALDAHTSRVWQVDRGALHTTVPGFAGTHATDSAHAPGTWGRKSVA